MKKFLLAVAIVVIMALAVVGVAVKYLAGPQIKDLLEREGSRKLHGEVHAEQIDVGFWPPVTLKLKNLKLKTKYPFPPERSKVQATLDAPSATVSVDWHHLLRGNVVAVLKAEKPAIKLDFAKIPSTAAASHRASKAAPEAKFTPPFPMGVKLVVKDGIIGLSEESDEVTLKNFDFQFEAATLTSPWSINASTLVDANTSSYKGQIPVKLAAAANFDKNVLTVKGGHLTVSGIDVNVEGQSDLNEPSHVWNADVTLEDLSKLPLPPDFLPKGDYSGGIVAKLRAEQKKESDWSLTGALKVTKLVCQKLDYKKEDTQLEGGFTADADVDFSYSKNLVFNKIVAAADLKDTAIDVKYKFTKPAGVPLSLDLNGRMAEKILTIEKGDAHFAGLNASATGSVGTSPGQSSSLKISIPRTDLAGFEKYFPPLNSSPLTGAVQVTASISGDLKNPKQLSLNFNPLLLDNVKGAIHEDKGDRKINGPVSVNAKAVIVTDGPRLVSASIVGQADLTQLDVFVKDQFQKRPGVVLKMDLAARQKGKRIELGKAKLETSLGPPVTLTGYIEEPQSPVLNLNLRVPELNLDGLSKMVPSVGQMKLTGKAAADVAIKGNYDFVKGIENSYINVTGKVSAIMPKFVYKKKSGKKSEDEDDDGGGTPPEKNSAETAASSESVLPDWPMMRTMRIAGNFKIGQLQYNDLAMTGVDANGTLNGGFLNATMKIQKIFGGAVNVGKFQMNLVQKAPDTTVQFGAGNVDIHQALAAFAPEWKDLAAGQATGTMSVVMPHPSRSDFKTKIQASGNIKVANGFLSTIQFDQYVNQKLKDLPGGGKSVRPVNSKGVTGNVDTVFSMSGGKINFKPFHMITPENNEMYVSGWVNVVDKTLEARGNVYLANANVGGDIKSANSDAKGRLFVPSVRFYGDVMKPEVDLTETLTTLLRKAAGGQVKKQIQNQLRNLNVPDDAKKKLQGLFGN